MKPKHYIFTSESVTEGHPDKVCDQISDAVLDKVMLDDPNGRVACETFITTGLAIVGGEITTTTYIDVPELVRGVVKDIGYVNPRYGFDYKSCAILNAIGHQSLDISQGVTEGEGEFKEQGAGDQGLMVGYACRETDELMPLPIMLAHRLCRQLARVRKEKVLPWLGPDGKSQVTVEYKDGQAIAVPRVVIAAQHTSEVVDPTGKLMTVEAKQAILEEVIKPVLKDLYKEGETIWIVNGTGKFEIGGPQSDTGMTGRKIIVDTYGGEVPHGGGAFSGKDPSKVDRSASYMCRYIAKNIVASGLADRCEIQLAYAIGMAEPVSVYVNAHGTSKLSDEELVKIVRDIFALKPKEIIEMLDLRRPIYRRTAAYGHFGREEEGFTWELTDKVEELKKVAG
ncbi:MAG: methionine adenosyltransferase [Candidatus Euphemobacter frigidus]|nr:methionine adenosyltransferase [Candidatus Euphemobacter frigidus]MDP8275195.1 methionine adenosyltransferase [Candidatus Euphemobacter frigidus]